jgi:hypothetical protein
VTATAGNASATVSWTAPANGGSPISSYAITPYIGSTAQTPTTITGSPPATGATVTGLSNGTAYTFKVTATNAVGTGPASAASNAVTPVPPIPAFVQQAATHMSNATSGTVTPASNVTAGNRLVVLVGTSGTTAKSVTDSAGNGYVELQHFTSNSTELSVWSAPITKGGATKPSITVTPTARAALGIAALEYSGMSAAADATVVDKMAQNSGSTFLFGGTVRSGSTAPTTSANELALGFYVDPGSGDNLSASSPFTRRVNISPTSDVEFLVEDELVGAGATPNAGVSTGSFTSWMMSTVVLKHG